MPFDTYQHALASGTRCLGSLDPFRQSAHRSVFMLVHALHFTEHDPCFITTLAQLALLNRGLQERRHF